MNSSNYLIKNSSLKNHYYIGTIINDEKTINQLKILQNVLKNKKFGIENPFQYRYFYSGFIYLGYIDDNIAIKIANYLSPLFIAITEEIGQIECEYTGFEYYHKHNIHAVNILYDSKKLCDIIVPYLIKFGITNFIETAFEPKSSPKLFIPLISINKIKNNNTDMLDQNIKQLYLPKNTKFYIETIDVISGVPVLNNINIVSSYPLKYK